MASSLQSLKDPERLANGPKTGPREPMPSEARHLSHLSPQKNCPVLRNLQSKLLMKETSLQDMKSELENYKKSNVRQSLQIMSLRDDVKGLQDLTASLVRRKTLRSTNGQSLEGGKQDLAARVTELENRLSEILHRVHPVEREKAEQKPDLVEKQLPCMSRGPPQKNTKGQEDSLDIFPVKDKAEAILTTNFEREKTFYSEGPKDGQQIWDECLQDLIHQENQTSELDEPPNPCRWGAAAEQSQHQNFLGQLAALLSDSIGPIAATEDAVRERIQEMGASERSWKSRAEGLHQEIQKLTKQLEQLHCLYEEAVRESPQLEENYREQNRPLKHLEGDISIEDFSPGRLYAARKKENFRTQNSQVDRPNKKFKQLETLLNIQQNLKTPRMEEKIQKLQKQLSDLKLSNKNMKTQLTRINVLKDKTIEKLRQSLTKAEALREKAVPKPDNLRTSLDSGEQAGTSDRVRTSQVPARATSELPTTKSTPKGVLGPEQELINFRETIMKMLGFNMKMSDKEIFKQLKFIIQVYDISKKSGCDTGQET